MSCPLFNFSMYQAGWCLRPYLTFDTAISSTKRMIFYGSRTRENAEPCAESDSPGLMTGLRPGGQGVDQGLERIIARFASGRPGPVGSTWCLYGLGHLRGVQADVSDGTTEKFAQFATLDDDVWLAFGLHGLGYLVRQKPGAEEKGAYVRSMHFTLGPRKESHVRERGWNRIQHFVRRNQLFLFRSI